jgi:N-acetylglucosaminyldiphosphoundecaprenol N-acetyl-beta-D-mannosaminyltransferase
MVAGKDPAFHQALLAADLLVPDGAGMIVASRILGGGIRRRVTGTDIFMGLHRELDRLGGSSVFFLGSSEANLARIEAKMAMQFPGIRVAGSYAPPFKSEFTDADNQRMVQVIHQARPDVLWVGMTAPKQEKWVHRHRDRLGVRFIGAVGAVFDFFTGNVRRSHPLFQQIGLEWFPRLLRQPGRLYDRTLVSAPLFLLAVMRQRLKGSGATKTPAPHHYNRQ